MTKEMILSLVAELRKSFDYLPTSREKSLAVTKLEECEMWLERIDRR